MLSRRRFLASSLAMAAALRITPHAVAAPLGRPVRVGFVGIGMKGSAHLGNLLQMAAHDIDGRRLVEVVAVCDLLERQCVESQGHAEALGLPQPTAYFGGEREFERMAAEEDLDLIYTATPWRWHTPVCLAALGSGSHAATEVPAAVTLEDCHRLVEAASAADRHCVMMENVNYMRAEMAIWRMVREGLLGEIVHYEGGYLHDTRHLKAQDEHDGLWLAEHHHLRNGSLYPTHAIGPAAMYLDINYGDRLDYLVSMSSNARGLGAYMTERLPPGHPKRERGYANGDVNTTLIKTKRGASIVVKHDTDLPRPYSRRNLVQGTGGLVRGFPTFNIALDPAPSNESGPVFNAHHKWSGDPSYLERYEHPLWRRVREEGLGTFPDEAAASLEQTRTDGAMWDYRMATEIRNGDFLEDYRLVAAIADGRAPDYDVSDAATWSAIAPLSETSVAERSRPVDVPDFTNGKWESRPPLAVDVRGA